MVGRVFFIKHTALLHLGMEMIVPDFVIKSSGHYCTKYDVKPKFHCTDFPVKSATNPWCTLVRGSFREVGVMEFGLKGTSRVCCGHHGEVGIVEFELNQHFEVEGRGIQYSVSCSKFRVSGWCYVFVIPWHCVCVCVCEYAVTPYNSEWSVLVNITLFGM